jgi:xylono-1,5-lactonase
MRATSSAGVRITQETSVQASDSALSLEGVGEPQCVWEAGAVLGEGALWSVREQCLYWVDILSCRIHRLDPATGQRASWPMPEEVSTLAERREGPGLAIGLRRGLALWDPAHPEQAPRYLCQPEPERSGNRFNDGKCDAQGRFWLGSMDFACEAPTGALYRVDATGGHERLDDGFAVSNGPTWIDEGRVLLFNDTVKARVLAYDFDPETGRLSGRREWLRLARGDGLPDGMTTDAQGRVWICHWGGACVSCHDPHTARELGRVRLPVSQVTSCAFGGPDLHTLYITSARWELGPEALAREPLAGGLFALSLPVQGRCASPFAG